MLTVWKMHWVRVRTYWLHSVNKIIHPETKLKYFFNSCLEPLLISGTWSHGIALRNVINWVPSWVVLVISRCKDLSFVIMFLKYILTLMFTILKMGQVEIYKTIYSRRDFFLKDGTDTQIKHYWNVNKYYS